MITLVQTDEDFERFLAWVDKIFVLGFDTETSIQPLAKDRVLHLVQLGDYDEQFIFNWHRLPEHMRAGIRWVLGSTRWVKVVHNLQFEAGMCWANDIELEGCFDTMTCEMVLYCGLMEDFPPLIEVVARYCGKLLNKDSQTTFGDPDMVLSDKQLFYAAEDVKYLVSVYRQQLLLLHDKDLEFVQALENDAALAYAEMSEEGIHLDVPYWLSLRDKAEPIVEEAKRKTDAWITHPDFASSAVAKKAVAQEDIIKLPMNYPKGLLALMQRFWPTLNGTSKAVVNTFLSKNNSELPVDQQAVLQAFAAGDKKPLEQFFIDHLKDDLVRDGYITPKGTILINWNSPEQALRFAQVVAPKLDGLSEKHLRRVSHPFFVDLHDYRESLKLITTYGESFVQKHLHPDGKIHTTYNQIVSTGRVSSRGPNMQNIPAKESVGNMYRNGFIPPEGWVIVDSDYAGQELVVIAYSSQDPVWLKALAEGKDLHSICAELVFKRKWKDAAEPGCAYYESQQKCKCKGHKRLRDNIKTINFGLAYGMTHIELSARLRITVQEAKGLMQEYFLAFPRIKSVLDYFGRFGVENGYIQTLAPFYRKRWFPFWKERRNLIEAHTMGVINDSYLGEVQRASMNQPVQGSSADMIKVSCVIIRNYIKDNGLRDRVKPLLQVHDQNTHAARKDYAETWKPVFTRLMEEAALLIIPNGLLKADTQIAERWQK